jgi:hypothetical protein
MGFSDKQMRALQRGVPARNIRVRKLNGRTFPYIEGWHAIAEANRIFGFAGWDRETVESRCILARETRGSILAIYAAKVRLTVRAEGATVVREGNGSGEARSASVGEAHEIALKAAETDATKRALATFGKPFGLALYSNGRPRAAPEHGTQGRVQDTAADPAESPVGPRPSGPQRDRGEPSRLGDAISPSPGQAAAETAPSAHPVAAGAPLAPASTPPAAAESAPGPVPSAPIDKSLLMFGAPRRERDKHHLLFVATQPCLICSRAPSDAHHLRFAQPRMIGRKVGDQFTVPLCRNHHRQVHECSDEGAWWSDLEIDAIEIAKGLWEQSRAKRAALVRNLPGAVDPLNLPAKP